MDYLNLKSLQARSIMTIQSKIGRLKIAAHYSNLALPARKHIDHNRN